MNRIFQEAAAKADGELAAGRISKDEAIQIKGLLVEKDAEMSDPYNAAGNNAMDEKQAVAWIKDFFGKEREDG